MEKKNLKVLIVGGVACGPKSASRLKRLMPEAEVTMLEKGKIVSYGACGLPYYVSGEVPDIKALLETPVGVKRDAVFFKKVKGFETLMETEALSIDREKKTVEVIDHRSGEKKNLAYDKLILATGAGPFMPPIEGMDLKGVARLYVPDDAVAMRSAIESGDVKKVVIVGAGLIGLEIAEALARQGVSVTIVEMFDYPLAALMDKEMGLLVQKHLSSKGVELFMGEMVTGMVGDATGRLTAVKTARREIDADMAIVSVGVRPRSKLARDAGMALTPQGAIAINEFCQTSDPDIYAGGDCAANQYAGHLLGTPLFTPLGDIANKHGRVIANHIAGIADPFFGVLGTAICKSFDFTVGCTGLTEKKARSLNYDVETVLCTGPDFANYYPGSQPICLKLIVNRRNRRILGAQLAGPGECDKRLDVLATAIGLNATAEQLAQLDLGYAPPYSPALDPVITGAHIMLNKLDGITRAVSPLELKEKLDSGADDFVLLDVRTPGEWEEMRLPYEDRTIHLPLGALREKYDQLPRDKQIIAFCKLSLRGYEAERILKGVGFDNVVFLDGGIMGWPYEVWIKEQ
ncbi:MAG: FAD-dependent oxidoreductase [Syntrophobacteria bacterium]